MKSICIVAYTDYLTDGRVMRHAESACHAGYDVDVITPIGSGEEAKLFLNNVTIHRLRTKRYGGSGKIRYILSYSLFFVRCIFRISWLHIKKNYKIVLVCNMPDFLVFCSVFVKMSGAKVILDIHDPMPHIYKAKFPTSKGIFLYQLILLQEKLSAAFSDKVLTVNEPMKEDFLVGEGIPPSKISVIPNFADERIFKAYDNYSIEFPIRMIYYGTISSRFGFDDVLSAILGIRHKNMLSFNIIGRGDAELMLQERIRALNLRNIVQFDNNTYPLRQLPDILCRYHLGLVPYSLSKATDYMLPVKLIELLAMGIPAITIQNTAIRHYIDEALYFAYDAQRIESLTVLIDRILDDPSLILSKRERILNESENFLWKNEHLKYLHILSQLSI